MGTRFGRTLTLMLGGTSLTDGRLCTPPLPWTRYLLQDMKASPYCKGPVRIINTGQGSQTSNFGATQAALRAPMRPTHVLMEDFGINDCAIGPVTIEQATINFNSMIASYRAANPDVIICHQTMSPASAADVNRVNLPDYYDNGLANAALAGIESLDNYYGTLIVPGGWPKPLPVDITVPSVPLTGLPSGYSSISPVPTWNPADKSASITLSSDSLTATRTVAPGTPWVAARATNSIGSGKFYFQATPTFAVEGSIGIGAASESLANYVGAGANGWGYYRDGSVYNNGGVITNIGAFISGDVIGIAIDTVANLIWFNRNYGIWNNSALADPATGIGGIAIGAGTYFPMAAVFAVNDANTGNFGGGDGLHPIWPNAFQLYSYPNILDWAERMMQDFWP